MKGGNNLGLPRSIIHQRPARLRLDIDLEVNPTDAALDCRTQHLDTLSLFSRIMALLALWAACKDYW